MITVLVHGGSPGPALFTQERVGLNGRRFRMLKFRSMVVDADAPAEPARSHRRRRGLFKLKSDLGHEGRRSIRRHSLDELPQLFNVLNGDMSLVGPRPPLASEVERYDEWAFGGCSCGRASLGCGDPGRSTSWEASCAPRPLLRGELVAHR